MAKKERYIDVANTIKNWRKANGMSQQEVADALGVERSSYAYYEKGSRPDLEVLEKICSLYGKTIEELISAGTNSNTDRIGVAAKEPEYETSWQCEDNVSELSRFEKAVLLKLRLMDFKQKSDLLDFMEDLDNPQS